MGRRPKTEAQVAHEEWEAEMAESDRRTKQRNRLVEPLQSAMTRARERRAFDTDREPATIARYEREAAHILALLREELMAEGSKLQLLATAPGEEPVDLLAAMDPPSMEGVVGAGTVATFLDHLWRRDGRGRHKRTPKAGPE